MLSTAGPTLLHLLSSRWRLIRQHVRGRRNGDGARRSYETGREKQIIYCKGHISANSSGIQSVAHTVFEHGTVRLFRGHAIWDCFDNHIPNILDTKTPPKLSNNHLRLSTSVELHGAFTNTRILQKQNITIDMQRIVTDEMTKLGSSKRRNKSSNQTIIIAFDRLLPLVDTGRFLNHELSLKAQLRKPEQQFVKQQLVIVKNVSL